jgi:hypothetical protein
MNLKQPLDRIFHWIAGGGPLLFFAVATAEGFLRGGYDPIAQPISALALGPRGWVQTLNFALLMASFLSFAMVLRTQLRPGVASIAGPAVFVLMAFGLALAGAFTMDAPGAAPTPIGKLHLAGGFLVFPWLPVALLILARRFRHDAGWRRYFGYTLATGLFSLATITFFLLFVGPPGFPRPLPGLAGLIQRLQLLPFFVWMAFVTHHAYQRTKARPTPAHEDSRAPAGAVSLRSG